MLDALSNCLMYNLYIIRTLIIQVNIPLLEPHASGAHGKHSSIVLFIYIFMLRLEFSPSLLYLRALFITFRLSENR